MRADGQSVRYGCENDERAHQIGKSSLTAQLNGAETRAQERSEDRGRDGTAELFVDLREEAGEGCRVVAG